MGEERRCEAYLTPREHAVLGLLAEGLTNRAIAERLVLSEPTVRQYVSSLLHKYGAHNRTELAARQLYLEQKRRQHRQAARFRNAESQIQKH